MPEPALSDYSSIPKISRREYEAAQNFVAVRCRALEFTDEESKDVLMALGLGTR